MADRYLVLGTSPDLASTDITDSTATGRALMTAADATAALVAAGLAVTPLGSSAGWTLSAGATIAASSLSLPASDTASIAHTRRVAGMEIVIHVAYPGAVSGGATLWADIGVHDPTTRAGVHAQVRGDGRLEAYRLPGWVALGGAVTGLDIAVGVWVRLLVTAVATVDAWYSSTSARPTSEAGWTYLGRADVTADGTACAGITHGTIAAHNLESGGSTGTAVYTGLVVRGWPV